MVKKLILFAILSPLAMQPVMKAGFLTRAGELATKAGSASLYGAKNLLMPWTWKDTKIINKDAVSIGTKTLEILSLAWGLGYVKNHTTRFPKTHTALYSCLPEILSCYSALIQGGKLYRLCGHPEERNNHLGHFFAITGLLGTIYNGILGDTQQKALYKFITLGRS